MPGTESMDIAKKLTDAGIPSPTGLEKWYEGTVRSILKNEKYKGCALLQKTFTPDFLTKIESVKDLPEPITEFDESLLCMAPSSHMWAGLGDNGNP